MTDYWSCYTISRDRFWKLWCVTDSSSDRCLGHVTADEWDIEDGSLHVADPWLLTEIKHCLQLQGREETVLVQRVLCTHSYLQFTVKTQKLEARKRLERGRPLNNQSNGGGRERRQPLDDQSNTGGRKAACEWGCTIGTHLWWVYSYLIFKIHCQ